MWDLALDPTTGDLVFDERNDIGGVAGIEIVNQRILVRCRIPRGTFKLDDDETLGSTLHTLTRIHSDEGIDNDEAEAAVQEALEPMTDIEILNIDVSIEDGRRLVKVDWQNASAEGEPVAEEFVSVPSFTTITSID